MAEIPGIEWSLVGIGATIIGAVWSLAWWLEGKFAQIKSLVHDQIEKLGKEISDKLDYHEKHDDTRFAVMATDLMDIKLRNATIQGLYLNSPESELTPISRKIKKILKD
jgi:hypothetical protein